MSRRSVGAAAALAVIGLIGWQIGWHRGASTRGAHSGYSRPELAGLVAAVGPDRPFEPRLSGGFAYGPYHAATRSAAGPPDLSPDIRIAVARLEKTAAGSRADTDWAALGVAYLVSEQFDKALEFLEASVATPAPNPVWLSDLSAAYLLVARRRERYELVPKAVAAAELAYRLDGRLREAAFNRALALEAIHLPGQAQNAWRAYRSLDLDSHWSGEALAHLSKLEQDAADTQTRWSSVDQTIDSAASGHGFDSKTIGPIRHRLRARIETDLLPAWADRELADDTAGAMEQLRRARTAADLLARAGGDQMPKDAIRAIEEADRGANRTLVRRLARAHLGFRDVSKIF